MQRLLTMMLRKVGKIGEAHARFHRLAARAPKAGPGLLVGCFLSATPVLAEDITNLMQTCMDTNFSADEITHIAKENYGFTRSDVHPSVLRMARVDEAQVPLLAYQSADKRQDYLEYIYKPAMTKASEATSYSSRNDAQSRVMQNVDGIILNVWDIPDKYVAGCLFFSFAPTQPLPPIPGFERVRHHTSDFGDDELFVNTADQSQLFSRTLPKEVLNSIFPERPQTTSIILMSAKRIPEIS